jgi:hypothetical protein
MHDRNVILKARQLGFTTEVCIIQLDLAIFHKKECALIAHSLDAKGYSETKRSLPISECRTISSWPTSRQRDDQRVRLRKRR